jgi:hypothetical protein
MIVYFSGAGGLGNNLFQLASAIYYCEKYNYELKIIKTEAMLFGTSNMFGKKKCLKINGEFISYDKTIFSKLQFIENIDVKHIIIVHNDYTNNIPHSQAEENNIFISGYNQNLNLFSSVMSKIPKYLHFDDIHIKNYVLERYPNIENSTILCVRIGDDFKHMNKITSESYLKALNFLNMNGEIINNIFIISDIPTDNFFNNKLTYFTEMDEPDIIQIYAGLLSKNIILSESTFHLWIAYLSSNFGENAGKKVVCFNDTDITNRNLCLQNWYKLDY